MTTPSVATVRYPEGEFEVTFAGPPSVLALLLPGAEFFEVEKQGENRYMATWTYRKRRRPERTGPAKPWETRRRRRGRL